MTDGLIAAYRERVRAGVLEPDPEQEGAAQRLQLLDKNLQDHSKVAASRTSLLARFRLERNVATPKGIYLIGGVGRGKTMLMDLFHGATSVNSKRRVHFHIFMLEVHRWIHHWRKNGGAEKRGADPILPLASSLASEVVLLCFDEFEVSDVADAMILRRLFSALWDQNVVVVMTSNVRPDDLYFDGLQRELFLPFIDLLKKEMITVELGFGFDYRLRNLQRNHVYFVPEEGDADFSMKEIFRDLVGNVDAISEALLVDGRILNVPRVNQGVVWFTFRELCEQTLGAADYLALVARYHTVLLSDIPVMAPAQRNEAKRFATLIDVLYEHKVKLVCNAATVPERLYPTGTGARQFARTVSRLNEMQTAQYLSFRRDG